MVVLIGLPGKSDRPGYQRLYLTTKLDYYAEFLVSGILNSEMIPADKSPFPGHEATQVTVARDANIQYITATSPQPVDEFDLDVRLGAQAAAPALVLPVTRPPCIDPQTHLRTCLGLTCHTCPGQATCHTCPGQATCHICPGQATCIDTQCNQQTCNTCRTQCNQNTCADTCPHTCITCQHPHCIPI
jgi:hypothetical protein